jgi:hypothetical protein
VIETTDQRVFQIDDKGIVPFRPKRTASWWSKLEDLQWPEKRARDMIRRRADALVEANVDTVIHFGFHFRFDFFPFFGAMHGLLADIAVALHEREIRFLDHYSCNLLARPNSEEERLRYHTHQRHHVVLYPDMSAAKTAGYDGYRFRDLCEVDLVTGGPAYTPIYNAEMLCHNNPNFLAMHAAYLNRLFSEVPLDGIQADDMCIYNYFRSCGCEFCRERFRSDYGHELPPLSDVSFWGETSGDLDLNRDTSGNPKTWGNYENPAFRDWVRMRYKMPVDHLKMVKDIIGPEKVLMTCCSKSSPELLNAMAMSNEGNIETCDWILLENCGLGVATLNWQHTEPEAILQKSIAITKTGSAASPIICSYTIYEEGAYLGWALARYWGVVNWISTLTAGLIEHPDDAKEEASLISPYNNWEQRNRLDYDETDVLNARIAFLRANRDCGRRDKDGAEYWRHSERWARAFLKKNIGYRFVVSSELENSNTCEDDRSPIVFDACECVSNTEYANITKRLNAGCRVIIVPPFGTHTEKGFARPHTLLEKLLEEGYGQSVTVLDQEWRPELVDELIEQGKIIPSVRILGENQVWAARLRMTNGGLIVHLLNHDLEGIEDPTMFDRWGRERILRTIYSTASPEPFKIEIRLHGVGADTAIESKMISPELDSRRELRTVDRTGDKLTLEVDMSDIRLYAAICVSL